MTKRFCDLCQTEITPFDDQPFIKQLSIPNSESTVVASLVITNERLHTVNDICNRCKLRIVNEGQPFRSSSVATLQQPPRPEVMPRLFTAEPFDTSPFVPSSQPATSQPEQPTKIENG
jgi:hypothetical protein